MREYNKDLVDEEDDKVCRMEMTYCTECVANYLPYRQIRTIKIEQIVPIAITHMYHDLYLTHRIAVLAVISINIAAKTIAPTKFGIYLDKIIVYLQFRT